MGWKDWPYWLKGFCIGILLIILLLFSFVSLLRRYCEVYTGVRYDESLLCLITDWGDVPLGFPALPLYFLILIFCTFIGWLYGKIKPKVSRKTP